MLVKNYVMNIIKYYQNAFYQITLFYYFIKYKTDYNILNCNALGLLFLQPNFIIQKCEIEKKI